MTNAETETPAPRIRPHIVTAMVNGKPRHRIFGINLRRGQTPESLDERSRNKLHRIARLYGLDLESFRDWWWFLPGDENGPSEHRLEKGDVILKEGTRGGAQYVVSRRFDEPLDWYARNGHITPKQRRAGKRFFGLWVQAGYRHSPAISHYGLHTGGEPDPKRLEKLVLEYMAAREAIRGTREKEITFTVCCMGERAGRHGQMAYLRSALDDLVNHFGFDY